MFPYLISVGSRVYEVVVQEAAGPSATLGAGPSMELGASLHLQVDGQTRIVEVNSRLGTTHLWLAIDGTPQIAIVRRQGEAFVVAIGEDQYQVQAMRKLPVARRGAGPAAGAKISQVMAPMPGLVAAVEVALGEHVEQGHVVAVMEAMKMQMEIRTPVPGRVSVVHVKPGQEVGGGATLVTLEPG